MKQKYMQECIRLADQTDKRIPGSCVGAIILSPQGQVVGRGFKQIEPGLTFALHAELVALRTAGESARGGCLVTSLEPCYPGTKGPKLVHSCCEDICAYGISAVVFGLFDDSDIVYSGRGVSYLRDHGVQVVQYDKLNMLIERQMSTVYQKVHQVRFGRPSNDHASVRPSYPIIIGGPNQPEDLSKR